MSDFTHFNNEGKAHIVDIGEKPETERIAKAKGKVIVNRETLELIKSGGNKKGDVLTVAQLAGIMGAKRTSELIPLAHPIMLTHIDVKLSINEEENCVDIVSEVKCFGKTGVEMEALSAVSVVALTVYDMCKAVQRDMVISDICLISKSGGVHGDYQRSDG